MGTYTGSWNLNVRSKTIAENWIFGVRPRCLGAPILFIDAVGIDDIETLDAVNTNDILFIDGISIPDGLWHNDVRTKNVGLNWTVTITA